LHFYKHIDPLTQVNPLYLKELFDAGFAPQIQECYQVFGQASRVPDCGKTLTLLCFKNEY
jgi:hypothetical protein